MNKPNAGTGQIRLFTNKLKREYRVFKLKIPNNRNSLEAHLRLAHGTGELLDIDFKTLIQFHELEHYNSNDGITYDFHEYGERGGLVHEHLISPETETEWEW